MSLSRPPDGKVAYFCNYLQTNTSSEIAEKKYTIIFFSRIQSPEPGALCLANALWPVLAIAVHPLV
jgi:hypothetical protein